VLGALGALVSGLVLFVLWEVFAPGERPPVLLAGCDLAVVNLTFKRDAGVDYRDYDLNCFVTGSASPPLCDDVIARYIATEGPLPKDVNVIVRRGDEPRSPDICRRHYHGDGTPAL
jgi:hypothetical protein